MQEGRKKLFPIEKEVKNVGEDGNESFDFIS